MPTNDDLRAALEHLMDQAPAEITGFRVTPSTHPDRRRVYLPLLVAATVLATVGGAVTLTSYDSSHRRIDGADAIGCIATSTSPATSADSATTSSASGVSSSDTASTAATPASAAATPSTTNSTSASTTATASSAAGATGTAASTTNPLSAPCPANSTSVAATTSTTPAAPSSTAAPSTTAAPTSTLNSAMFTGTSYAFSVGQLPDGLHVAESQTATSGDQMIIDTSDNKPAGVITVLSPSAGSTLGQPNPPQWYPATPADAVPVKIGSQTGFYGTISFDTDPDLNSNGSGWFLPEAAFLYGGDSAEPGIVWHDASGAAVYITGVAKAGTLEPGASGERTSEGITDPNPNAGLQTAPLTQAQTIAVANAIHLGTPQTAKTPIKLGYLPAGFAPEAAQNLADPALASIVPDHLVSGVTLYNPATYDSDTYGLLYVGVASGSVSIAQADALRDNASHPNRSAGTTIDINGFTGKYSPDNMTVVLSNGKVSLIFLASAEGQPEGSEVGVTQDDLTKIVQGITVASSLTDQSTWFDADKAFS